MRVEQQIRLPVDGRDPAGVGTTELAAAGSRRDGWRTSGSWQSPWRHWLDGLRRTRVVR
jgi:hypothetical protein